MLSVSQSSWAFFASSMADWFMTASRGKAAQASMAAWFATAGNAAQAASNAVAASISTWLVTVPAESRTGAGMAGGRGPRPAIGRGSGWARPIIAAGGLAGRGRVPSAMEAALVSLKLT